MSKIVDLSGQKFNDLIVIERGEDIVYNDNKHRVTWKCLCNCGNYISVRTDHLKSNKVKSCGKCKNDLTNKRFGLLTALEQSSKDKHGHIIWKCICDCGNIKNISATSLVEGHTQSCGCLHSKTISEKKRLNVIGEKYNHLTIISLESVTPRLKYLCRCDCGNTVVVALNNIRNGHTKSCGCLVSAGEEVIGNYLSNHNINHKSQYSVEIDGFLSKARFDFAIYDKNDNLLFLIEYHGSQHYYKSKLWDDSDEDLVNRRKRDRLKYEWAKSNNISLYVIPYWDYDNIDNILNDICLKYNIINNESKK